MDAPNAASQPDVGGAAATQRWPLPLCTHSLPNLPIAGLCCPVAEAPAAPGSNSHCCMPTALPIPLSTRACSICTFWLCVKAQALAAAVILSVRPYCVSAQPPSAARLILCSGWGALGGGPSAVSAAAAAAAASAAPLRRCRLPLLLASQHNFGATTWSKTRSGSKTNGMQQLLGGRLSMETAVHWTGRGGEVAGFETNVAKRASRNKRGGMRHV